LSSLVSTLFVIVPFYFIWSTTPCVTQESCDFCGYQFVKFLM